MENCQNTDSNSREYSDITFVGDRSGSMRSMGDAPASGAREFIEKQIDLASKTNSNTTITVVTFDHAPEVVFSRNTKDICESDLDDVENKMVPRGGTRLIDTALEQLEAQTKRVEELLESGATLDNVKVVYALLTDGQDNESVNNSSKLQKEILKLQEKYDATCLFLAANQDAITQGEKYGFQPKTCLTMGSDPHSSKNAIRSVSNIVERILSGTGAGEFTELERSSSVPDSF